MSLRIISGDRRGAKIRAPEGDETRPLRDRVRQALFNILRPELAGAIVLDAFAGSGAVGLEAISNGAGHATLVDNSPSAFAVIRANVAKLRYEEKTTVIQGKTPDALLRRRGNRDLFTLLMLMPPYRSGLCTEVLKSSALMELCSHQTLAVCEIHSGEPFELPEGWTVRDDRNYGVTRLVFLDRATSED